MRSLRHFITDVETYGRRHEALYFFSFILFFWAIFEGITSYITPLVLTEGGLSLTAMGLIYASSSVFGAGFDFLMVKLFKNIYWRRVFLAMFALSFLYLLILASAKGIFLFLLAMMVWGFYYDLKNFGLVDFVARFTKRGEHSSSIGVVTVFQAGGFLIGPLIAGFLITETVGINPFIAAAVFLTVSLLILFLFIKRERRYPQESLAPQYEYRGFLSEFSIWKRIDKILLPVLIMATMLNIFDAFFWTVGPLLAESFTSFHQFAGIFMTAYELPALFAGLLVGSITSRFGKKRTSFVSLMLGSVLLSIVGYLNSPILIVATVFLASSFTSFAWPALRGAFTDYIEETGKFEKEIEGLEDLYTNIGYIIGPALAGILADQLGNAKAFTVLGVIGAMVALYLMKITPRKINILSQINKVQNPV